MKFRVRLLPRARIDANLILKHIAGLSASGGRAWVAAFEQAITRLKSAADTFAPAREVDAFREDLREVLFNTRRGLVYRMVFVIRGDSVHVLRVRGPGQDDLSGDSDESSTH